MPGDRNEHRHQDECGGDDRAHDLGRRPSGGLARQQALLVEVSLGVLDHYDGVVHHDSDGQHEAEERQRVDREPEHADDREGPDQRHRDGQGRDQRRAPVLQEDVDGEDDEPDGDEERPHDLLDRDPDELGRVVGTRVGHAVREARGEPRHGRLDPARHVEGVGARQLEDADERRRLAADAAERSVVLGAQLHAADVAESQHRAIGPRAENDLLELGRHRQAAAGGDGVLELLAPRRRGLADLPGRRLEVLLADRIGHVAGGESEAREPVGIQPEAHPIVPPVEHGHLSDAGHARQHVDNLERGVVAQVELVPASVG